MWAFFSYAIIGGGILSVVMWMGSILDELRTIRKAIAILADNSQFAAQQEKNRQDYYAHLLREKYPDVVKAGKDF